MKQVNRLMSLLVAVALTACAGADERPLDDEDAAFLVEGKADAPGVAADSPEACAILKLASEADLAVLDDDVTLNAKAAARIVAARAGDDGEPGTPDDEGFATLAALDAVKYVGPAAFQRLLAYVTDHAEWACGQVPLQLLAINDFHGALEPPTGSGGKITTAAAAGTTPPTTVDAGGAEYLATHLRTLAAKVPHTLVVAAGDLVGATPLLSSAFHDEPTVEALNLMALTITAVGNHEFDEGLDELLRLQYGECHPVEGCYGGDGFDGAAYTYLAANVLEVDTGETVLPPYAVRYVGKTPVAFIGLTLEGTPLVVTEAGVRGLSFLDEVETINALVPELLDQGIQAIVVLLHEGGAQTGLYSECAGASGPIVDIVKALRPEVDVVVTGHTHNAYLCTIDGRLVTSAANNGRLITDLVLTLDEQTGDVVAKTAENVIVSRTVEKDAALTALIESYKALVAPLANRVVATIAGDLVRAPFPGGDSPAGDAIADAQLAATAAPLDGGAVVAFMNPGGVRADLLAATISGGEQPGEVTYAELFAVQPFSNNLITMTLTGAQIERVLEEQWFAGGKDRSDKPMILGIPEGFTYAYRPAAPAGDRVDPAGIQLNGAPLDPAASYRVTVNVFLSTGGDGFATLKEGTGRKSGPFDLEALEAFLKARTGYVPPATGRITTL